MAHSKIAAMTFCMMAALGFMAPASAQTMPARTPLLSPQPAPLVTTAPPGMINGIGPGFGEQPNRNGTISGAGADGSSIARNPALYGGKGSGTGMVPKPAGQGE